MSRPYSLKEMLPQKLANENAWLMIILLVAAVLRFYHFTGFSLSNDELSALNRLHFSTFNDLVYKGFYVDGHPGGIQIFLWYWTKIFGESEASLRLPFVLMGIAAVYMTFRVAGTMFGRASGLFSAAAVAFLPFPLLYSQVARPYISGMLFCLMLIYFWHKILFDHDGQSNSSKPKLKHLAGFALSAALCMYNHYFSFLFAVMVGLSGFIFIKKQKIIPYLTAALLAALAFVPHIPITINHLTYKGVGLWLGVPGKTWLFEHLFFALGQTGFMAAEFAILPGIFLYRKQQLTRAAGMRWIMAAWFLLPIAIGYFYSVKVNPVLQHPVLIFSFPCLIMLIFSFAGEKLDKTGKLLLVFLLAAGVFNTVFVRNYYHEQHFGEFKETARLTAHYDKNLGKDSITSMAVANSPAYLGYYLKMYGSQAKYDFYNTGDDNELTQLAEIVLESQKPFFMFVVTKPNRAECEDIIRAAFPHTVEYHDFAGLSSFALYAKKGDPNFAEMHNLKQSRHFAASLHAKQENVAMTQNDVTFTLDSTTEYSPGIEVVLSSAELPQHAVIQAYATTYSNDLPSGCLLVLSLETTDGKSILWQGAEAKYFEVAGEYFNIINTLDCPAGLPENLKLKAYIWNKVKRKVLMNKLECSIFTPL